MAFDSQTRNRLARFVAEARDLIADEFTQKFQSLYGLSSSGEITPLAYLRHLDEEQKATAERLRGRLRHLEPDAKDPDRVKPDTVEQLVREQAFTVLNRLAAIRMAEKRDIIVESVGRGYESKGFKVYLRVAGNALGDTYHKYRRYLFCLFDELAVDVGALFDRRSSAGLLFLREPALLQLLQLLNAPDLDSLWAEDETIGWIYQYYNDPAERKKMREQSSAPRTSRELAIRNQFFTPRYVVEFLSDNTLGRIWYEMTKGQTRLKEHCRYLIRRPNEIFLRHGETAPEPADSADENLSQEELLKQPVHIPHRPLKDPRTIRMLDPACGSMHFGLYSFDLFEVIYDEAWEIAHGSDDALKFFEAFAPFVAFVGQYPDKSAFLCEVPRLIIERNIHGIDIDPRCVQIAGLSLWLRAQSTWQQQRLQPVERPQIRRSNIVCAEPMPGEEALLNEFIEAHFSSTSEKNVLGQLFRRVFDAMKHAGEAGSLLKIEEEIAGAVAEAKQKWLAGPRLEQGRLFADDMAPPAQK
ncbi:MAG: SAM-dependent methyltransferase, partial [Verrucomicrobia bacterium]|nr:SAM-dependent methyltransferase [Verrucomicrobiota bacterium]